ncbi:MAG: hypothetical protein JXR56_05815 [Candidatus Cloacimonetes bacterium]|nr:hypothetical protein [Candidatus Cloacimonadota bacterium]
MYKYLLCLLFLFLSTLYAESNFNQIKGDSVIIQYKPEQVELARYLTSVMDRQISVFQKKLGVYPDSQVTVTLSPSEEWYRERTEGRKEIVKKAQAYFDSSNKTIIIRDPGSQRGISGLRTVFMHEYIHYFIDSYIAGAPLWFHEGMAVYFSGGYGINHEILFAWGYLFGRRPALMEMVSGYPDSQNSWEMFYAVSALAVKTMYKEYKPEFYRFWYTAETVKQQTGGKVQFGQLFRKNFFMTVSQFDTYFGTQQKRVFIGQSSALTATFIGPLMAIILVLAFIRKKRDNRRLSKQWTEEEELADESPEAGDPVSEGSGTEEGIPTQQTESIHD